MAAMVRPFEAYLIPARAPSQRLLGTLAVGFLHVLIIAGLLRATLISVPPQRLRHEIEIWFLFPPKPKQTEPTPSSTQKSGRPVLIPDYNHIALPPPADTGATNRPLLNCDLDHQMTPEERARCAREDIFRHDDGAVDYAGHLDLSVSAALWEARRERRNAPLLLPCADPQATGHMLHLDLICAGKVLLGGVDGDTQPGYGSEK